MKNTLISTIPGKTAIEEAHERIRPYIHRTPVLTCESINRIAGATVFFKCENFQKVGAFKFRGASNAVFSLNDEALIRGVATHSSGNHAQALALAAKKKGIPAYIVMPENASGVKIEAVKSYGAKVIFCKSSLDAREKTLEKVVNDTGATFIHPYDDYRIIAGQATAAKELIEDTAQLDIIVTPVGGGGLLSGTALAAKYFSSGTMVYAGEPMGADDAYRSLQEGKIIPSINPDTIADGLLTSLGEKTFEIIQREVQEIITVDDNEIIAAMKLLWERMKIVVEPSGAVPFAAVLKSRKLFSAKSVGIILSGGNVDLTKLPF